MPIDDDGPVEMKFVIKGRTFDTATSNVVAIDRGIAMRANRLGDHEKRYESVLYRTAKGTFFLHDHSTVKYLQGGKPVTEDDAEDLTPEQAIEWIENHVAVVMNDEGLALRRKRERNVITKKRRETSRRSCLWKPPKSAAGSRTRRGRAR